MERPDRELELPPIPTEPATARIQTLAIWVVTGAVGLAAGSLLFATTFAQREKVLPERQGAVLARPHCRPSAPLVSTGRERSEVESTTDLTKAIVLRDHDSATTNACP